MTYLLTKKDQNGNVHTYDYDVLGRSIADSVTVAAGNPQHVDTAVLRIQTDYNTQGLADTVTSFSSATGGSAALVNQVQNVYNGFGQLIQQYQSHSGTVITSGATATLSVSYGYSTDVSHTGGRLISMTYPSGLVLSYNYGSTGSLNDVISRLDSMSEPSGNSTVTLESYKYLGLSTVVERDHPQDGYNLTYIKQAGEANGPAGDPYNGLDQFGRVVDQRWINTNGTANSDADRYTYTYDRDGNILTKNNTVNSGFNETYTYDALNQLASYTRNGTSSNYQSFSLDALGNMNSVTTGNSTVSETHNSQNELTGMGNTTLTYDNNGNTLTDDQGRTLVYDAWNRLIAVNGTSGQMMVTYAYDGTGRRITEAVAGTNPTQLYYSTQWQVVQEDTSGTSGNATLTLHAQYVWSAGAGYPDAMVCRDMDFNSSGTLNPGTLFIERTYALQDAGWNVTSLVNLQSSLPGDVNFDGRVGADDYVTLNRYFGQHVAGGAQMGDVNDDGVVIGDDYVTLNGEYGQSGATTSWKLAERFVYDAYGKFATYLVGSGGTLTVGSDYLAWNYNPKGGRWDYVTGMYSYRGRDYSVTLMRWVQAEP